jgi:itaconate CoA-transferase
MIVPYGAYPCADGDVMFAVQNAAEWRRFCNVVMQQPGLADDAHFSTNTLRLTNRAQLETMIEKRFRDRSRTEVMAWLMAADVATANVNDVPAVASHPQLAARGRWMTVASPGGEIPALVPPHNLRSAPPRMGAVPALGEHTNQVFAELQSSFISERQP